MCTFFGVEDLYPSIHFCATANRAMSAAKNILPTKLYEPIDVMPESDADGL